MGVPVFRPERVFRYSAVPRFTTSRYMVPWCMNMCFVLLKIIIEQCIALKHCYRLLLELKAKFKILNIYLYNIFFIVDQ